MWNQLWAEGSYLPCNWRGGNLLADGIYEILGVLLIRTYAFLGNKMGILIPLVFAISAVAAYQLYVDITKVPHFKHVTITDQVWLTVLLRCRWLVRAPRSPSRR